jgi:LacI family transcriptional regulator
MVATLRDIAERCGVSRATVSLVLQDSHRVSEPTKVRVRQAMAEMDYVYDRRAAHLRGRRTHGVGVVLTDIHNPALADLAMVLEDAAHEADCNTMMSFTGDDSQKQARIIRAMMEYRLDGIVLSPAKGTSAADLSPLDRSGVPYVLVTRRVRDLGSDYVGPNNAMAGRLLVDHLVALGARSVAFLGGSHGVSARLERVTGMRDRWRECGLVWQSDLSIATNALEGGGCEAVRILASKATLPDAIVGYSDTVARGILLELRHLGIQPGRDIAVAGFDNDPVAMHLHPSLTSVDTFMGRVGEEALRLLLTRIVGSDRESVTTLIKPELHARESTEGWVPTDSGVTAPNRFGWVDGIASAVTD